MNRSPNWSLNHSTINQIEKSSFFMNKKFFFEEVFKHPSQVYLRVMDDFTTIVFLFLSWFLLVYFYLTNQFHKQCLCLVCLYKIKEQNQIYSFIRKNKQIIFLIIKKKKKKWISKSTSNSIDISICKRNFINNRNQVWILLNIKTFKEEKLFYLIDIVLFIFY